MLLNTTSHTLDTDTDTDNDTDLVLPLELGPHVAEVRVAAGGGLDVVHDVDVDVVEHNHAAVRARPRNFVHCRHDRHDYGLVDFKKLNGEGGGGVICTRYISLST